MSMTASYRRVSAVEWASVQSEPEVAKIFFGEAAWGDDDDEDKYLEWFDALEASGNYLDIQKDWEALHFLLTRRTANDKNPAPAPLNNAVLGGTETEFDATYGKVRFLTPDEVKEVNKAFSQIAPEDLKSNFSPAVFTAKEIYPNPRPGGWQEDDLENLFDVFSQVRDFFQEAAGQGEVMLLSLD